MKLYLVTPTYNEKENIEILVKKIYRVFNENGLNGGVIVVDDNSPDGTGKIVDKLVGKYQSKSFELVPIHREGKLGFASAHISGFRIAFKRGADIIMQIDADLSHPPEKIPEFVKEIKKADMVIGSRYVKGGGVENWGLVRKIISRGGSLYSRMILGIPVKDVTGGFNCFRKKVLEEIGLDSIKSNGYSFQIELRYKAFKKGFKLIEIPFIFKDRTGGKSKMSKRIFFEAMKNVPLLRIGKL